MDFRDVIELNRSKLEIIVDAEKLYPHLQQDNVLSDKEISLVESVTNKPAKVGKLLDIILSKDSAALQSLYLVLQNVYQQQLSSIFSEPPFSTSRGSQQAESCSTSITSDSEDDISRGQLGTGAKQEFHSKKTKIIPSHQYDPNSTMSSSYPTSREHLWVSVGPTSPSLASLTDALPKHGYPDKAYEWFFNQFERAFTELQFLKQQNAEMMGMRDRYELVTTEAKQLRGMYQAESQCLNKATAEIHALKTQQAEMLSEKNQLLEELAGLRQQRAEDKHELSELRHQQRKTANECNSNDNIGEMYTSLLDKYESMHKDYDVLRDKYAELMSSHSAALSRLDSVSEQNAKFHAQLEELQSKYEALSLERNGLKQQCTNAIREWNQTLINYGQVKEKLSLVIQQRDDYCKDFNQTFAKHAEMKKNYEALRTEKDAAVKEYALVMSERDTVHKEIEQLQDKLNAVTKHAEILASDKKAMEVELECLRRDMANVLSERDKYRRDISGINQGLKQERLEFQKQRDIARKEAFEQIEQMEHIFKDTYEKERAEEMDSIIKESENLKKQLEKLKIDLDGAEQEAENANKNRDKAFSERDKIVQERESIRTLCDNLRRDRDRAVSDLAQALRDSDEFKRQKNDAVKELKEIKSRYEAIVEKDSRRQQLHYIGHNHSRDSAIDADLQDLGTETIEIPIELDCSDAGEVGFEIIGGKDDPQFHNDPSLMVSHVTKGGLAEGKLRVNDTILRINSLETINIDKRSALQAIWKSSGSISLVVRRRKSTHARIWQPVQIVLACQKDPGVQIEQGLFISRICPGGLVAKYGMLPCIGDRIISINNTPTDGLSAIEAMRILETSTDSLILDVMRQKSPLSSAGSSPTPTFIGINSPLSENIAGSNSISKSDTLAVRSSSWETPSDTSRSVEGSKIVRSSGSQTDSLDSPGPSPRKAMRSQEHDKVRHSLPMLDRAKEKVENFFKSRHKSHEKELGEKKDKDDEDSHVVHDHGKSLHKLAEDSSARIHLHSSENVIAEFPNNSASSNVSNHTAPTSENRPSRPSRKSELDFDSNSGTWPKTRGQQIQNSSGPPTVIFAPGHRPVKERPSIKEVFYINPDSPSYNASSNPNAPSLDTVKPSNNGFPSYGAQAPSAFSSPTSSSVVSAPPYHMHNVQSSPTPFTIPVWTKPTSHFSVGIAHGPSISAQSSIVTSRGPPVLDRPVVIPTYGTAPLPKAGDGNRNTMVYTHPGNIQTVGPGLSQDMRFETNRVHGHPKSQHVKSRRPMSTIATTPYKSEKHWQTSVPMNWPPNRITPDSLPGHVATPAGTSHCLNSSNTSFSTSTAAVGTPPSYYTVNSPGPQSHLLSSPPAYGNRPMSLEVPHSLKVSDFATELYERKRMNSPVGYYHYQPVSAISPQVSTTQHTALSSPNGTFPVIGTSDLEHERPLSFHGGATERYNSPSPSQKSFHTLDRFTPTLNEEFYPPRYSRNSPHGRNILDDDIRPVAFNKRDLFDRFRIPSSTSVKSGSAEIVSNRSSPSSPMFPVNERGSMKYNGSVTSEEYIYRRKMPNHHETRDITFEKSSKPVGFKIQGGPHGGIFVSSVNENSLAAQAGLVIGDQLLEVCGINMRNANYEHAVTVLRQCGDNLTIKVQYNPEKYTEHQDVSSSVTSINSSSLTTSPSHSSQPANEKSSSKAQQSPTKTRVAGSGDVTVDIRRSFLLKKSNPNRIGPGFSFIGGNAVGIFIDEVFEDYFVGGSNSLQRGDQLLEYNSIDFRAITAEKAMMELNLPCPTMQLCVFYNFAKYNKIKNIPCDSFYIRANFDRPSETEENLSFHKDDILYVENSLYKNQLGSWYAWLVNDHGTKIKAGVIPSRIRLEDEMVLRRSHSESWSLHESDELKGSRRNSMSARRSFFRRKRHLRNNSKDSHDFVSFSDASLNSDSVPILDDSILGYTQVEKIEFKTVRPVLLLAPLAEALIRKLESESPDLYKYCQPIALNYSPATLEKSLSEGVLVDYWKEDDTFKCVKASAIKDICDHNLHCLLNVKPGAIERLHQSKIYPIIIFVHHKSAKQIRDVRDPQFLKERPNNKWAKEQFEYFQKIEQEFQHLFTAVIYGGNLAEMCMQIKTVIATEQKKAIWVTANTI
ncbi:disks large 5-like isoform X1 [Biomphalaria pfeifferi]|uniref:Disks large 5-like isoform X1 n=1 Tax=Biomphalaria pfeifferi TaxID=112525 RepID=A0AAD8B855_BIOPF|nr:disks large 5-like isoform X1 [Biomphalaria pfeifferi]